MTNSSNEHSRQDKIQLLELIDERDRRRREDPLKYAKQHDKQKAATASMAAIRALFWGNRVGKTEWGGQESSRFSTGNHPFRKIPASTHGWVCCPSFDVQEETTQKKILSYLPEKDIARREYLRGRILRRLVLKNGSTITFKSYEQGREKFQGAGKDWIWFDEEPPKDIWEECFVRMEAGRSLSVWLTMTAIKGMTWVYDEIYLDTNNPDLYVSTAGWDDNPFLTAIQKEQMARGLSKSALQVRKEGKFVKRVGLVCAWWDRNVHIRHYDSPNRSWTWYEVLDGGFSDPAAWLLAGVDGDNNVHIVNGYRRKQLGTKRIKELRDNKISGLTLTNGWVDTDNPRLQIELEELGMNLETVEKRPNESKSWDETLADKLEEYGQVQPGTGQPRLYLSDNLIEFNEEKGVDEHWLMQEIENLVWLERTSKQGTEIIPQWDDHRRFGHHFDGMRALAYLLVSYAKAPKVKTPARKPENMLRRKHRVR